MYHTCYTLSGLSVAQHCENDMYPLVIGDVDNEVHATHPMYNIPAKAVWTADQHFRRHNYDLYANDDNAADHSNGASPDFWAELDASPKPQQSANRRAPETDTEISTVEESSSTAATSDRASSVATTDSCSDITSASGSS